MADQDTKVEVINKGGRPLKFKTPAELEAKINAYFKLCDPHYEEIEIYDHPKDKKGKILYDQPKELRKELRLTEQIPYTITGLALALDTSRETLLEYQEREEFVDAIKRAKLRCQNFTELKLYGPNATGPIFSLKNNYGWKDEKTETGTIEHVFGEKSNPRKYIDGQS